MRVSFSIDQSKTIYLCGMQQQKRHSNGNMFQKYFFVAFLLYASFGLCAQELDSLSQQDREEGLLFQNRNAVENPVRVQLNTGMSVFNSFGNQTGTFSFVNPNISFQLNERLAIHTSFVYSYGMNIPFLTLNTENKHFEIQHADLSTALLAVGGSYAINPNLIVSGGIWKEMTMQPIFNEPKLNPRITDLEAEGITLGVRYKPTENIELNAVFNYSRGNSPFYNPFVNTLLPCESSFLMHNRSPFVF